MKTSTCPRGVPCPRCVDWSDPEQRRAWQRAERARARAEAAATDRMVRGMALALIVLGLMLVALSLAESIPPIH